MHLKNPLLFGLMAILLLAGTITPGLSQTTTDLDIVINEVEINPTGSDVGVGINPKSVEGSSGSQEFVELFNPNPYAVDISGWLISPSASWKSYEIPDNTIIQSNSFLAFTHLSFWLKDFGDNISLVNNLGDVVDQTPLLIDEDDDSRTWQRTYDGMDTNSESDWEFKRMTPKSSNGKIIETFTETFSLTLSVNKENYLFNETVTISGSVSDTLQTDLSYPELIKINVTGESYFKNIALYPDRDKNFSTTLSLQKVLGFNNGDYSIDASYGENKASTTFSIITNEESIETATEGSILEIFTDKESYIPGETVILSADVESSFQYSGLDYIVLDPNKKKVFEGTIFPNSEFSTVFQAGSGQIFPFSTQLFMSPVNPIYGTYEISGIYKSQHALYHTSENTIEAYASFDLVEDVKEDTLISISSEKDVYSVDDIITITGRSNEIWVEDFELKVVQTGLINHNSLGAQAGMRYVAADPFNLHDTIRLNGDGTFDYSFKLIESYSPGEDYTNWYGDYKVIVSEYFGDASVSFKVVEDPDSFVELRTPLGLKTNDVEYVLGSPLKITGKVLDFETKNVNDVRNAVEIILIDSTGKTLQYNAHQQKSGYTNCNTNDCSIYDQDLIYKAFPDQVGSFEVDIILHPLQFDLGKYTALATHRESKTSESVEFTVKSALSDQLEKVETEERIKMQICKSNRAHVDEILKDLTQIGKGEIPPSMESIDCSNNNQFEIGDKLVVKGNVVFKDPRTLTSTYADRSSDSQTSDGHSYSTNYAQATMNYVEVSIPYPKSLVVTKSAGWVTIPDEGENYTGGGGTGGGSNYYKDKEGNVVRPDNSCEVSAAGGCTPTKRSDRLGEGSYDGQAILKKQKMLLTDMNYKAYPDSEGNFFTIFELRAGVFSEGIYTVKANYYGYNTEELATVIDNSLKGGLEPEIVVNLEKDEFIPGETVKIQGQIKNIYYYDTVSAKIDTPDVSQVNCLEGQQCGFGNSDQKIRVQEGVNGPIFFWNYKIPNTPSAIGTYKLTIDTHFDQLEKEFFVIDQSETIDSTKNSDSSLPTSKKIIEKFNRISDNKIPISLSNKPSEDTTLEPRVLQGSLFTSARGEESSVNLKITTSDGQCVIGQELNCLVSESTRKPGAIFAIVSIDDINYKIRYSGNDVRLEKFSIVPEESGSKININDWNVEIIKDEQPSRFYYKVSYVALE